MGANCDWVVGEKEEVIDWNEVIRLCWGMLSVIGDRGSTPGSWWEARRTAIVDVEMFEYVVPCETIRESGW